MQVHNRTWQNLYNEILRSKKIRNLLIVNTQSCLKRAWGKRS